MSLFAKHNKRLTQEFEHSKRVNSIQVVQQAVKLNAVTSSIADEIVGKSEFGSVIYRGQWDASSGNPPSLTPSKGSYWVINVEGTTDLSGITEWQVDDWAVFNGTAWDKIDNTDAVSSVNGKGGAVLLTTDDIEEGNDNLYYTEERVSANEDVAANTADRHTPFCLHVQEVASNTWTITHNLNRYVSVAIIDSSNRQVIGDIEYLNINQIIVSFNGSFAGKAYLV